MTDKPYKLIQGDCIEKMKELPENSVDAIVTDPPYGLGFMNKDWDSFKSGDTPMRRRQEIDSVNTGMSRQGGRQRACADYQKRQASDMRAFQKWCEEWANECLRVLKPGGHLLAFSGSRTYHRMTCAIEDAGFEVRDQMMWVYGSGFPKSLNVGKKIEGWDGWGTALKPAHEPICVARKPLDGTVAENIRKWGVGGLNIDGCRVGTEPSKTFPKIRNAKIFNTGSGGQTVEENHQGRWPANLMHDGSEEVLGLFPSQAGGGFGVRGGHSSEHLKGKKPTYEVVGFGDSGSAARFFYCPKASKRDRNEGCEDIESKPFTTSQPYGEGAEARADGNAKGNPNNHPTVKPTELMRYLCRLVTPPGGTVLDPFNGSGSTGKAAMLEGFRYIGIEKDAEYIKIAEARISGVLKK